MVEYKLSSRNMIIPHTCIGMTMKRLFCKFFFQLLFNILLLLMHHASLETSRAREALRCINL